MSNPGVISLVSDLKQKLKIEDNIGEAIHLHYDSIRLDLTIEEFEKLSSIMNHVIDEMISIEGFSSSNINPENLVQVSHFLPKLEKIKMDEIYLEDLLINTKNGKYVPIKNFKKFIPNNAEIKQNEQIVLYGKKDFVICGQNKCKNIYATSGNIKIPVIRMFFDKTITIKDIQKKQRKATLGKRFLKFVKWVIRHIIYT